MKVFSKRIVTLALAGLAIGVTGHAQEVPASSVTGTYRAGPGLVLPANICTSDNALCFNATKNLPPLSGISRAEVQAMIDAASLGGSSKAWTLAFVGQSKCANNTNDMYGLTKSCAAIQPSGDSIVDGNVIVAPTANGIASGNPHAVCTIYRDGSCGGYTIANSTLTPVNDSAGKVIDWIFDYGLGAYNPAGI